MTGLEFIQALNEEGLIWLLHAYDHHILACERENQIPMLFEAYALSNDYMELVESDEIYDLLEYESDLEEASIEDLQQLAIVFAERLAKERQQDLSCYTKLDLLIDELEVGLELTEEEREASQRFNEKLFACGYLPTEDGTLHRPTAEELKDLTSNDFQWDDFKAAHEIVKKYPNVHVATVVDGGRYLIAQAGWRLCNRIAYYLSSEPLLDAHDEVIL